MIEYVTEKIVVDRQSRFRCRHVGSGFDWYFLQVPSEISRVFLDRKKKRKLLFSPGHLVQRFFFTLVGTVSFQKMRYRKRKQKIKSVSLNTILIFLPFALQKLATKLRSFFEEFLKVCIELMFFLKLQFTSFRVFRVFSESLKSFKTSFINF